MKLKILWYNVFRGFHKKEGDSFTFEEERLKLAKKVIALKDPDIVCLGEADFNPLNTIKGENIQIIDYAKVFNYPYFFYSKVTERKGEAVLSKFPFNSNSKSVELFSLIESKFLIDKKKITIDLIHPYPKLPELEKAKWIEKVLGGKGNNYILLGDFNALSPEDKYIVEELTEGFKPSRGDLAKENALDTLKALMIKNVLNKGLIDSYRKKNKDRGDSFPTKGFSPFKDKGSMRLDYIFCSKDFKVISSELIKNKFTHKASDHYPLYAELELV